MKTIQPSFQLRGFHCPHCGVFAHQIWFGELHAMDVDNSRGVYQVFKDIHLEHLVAAICQKCSKCSVWHHHLMVFPAMVTAPLANDDMPDDVKADFLEARTISHLSPRGAAALLRLAIQKLMPHLGEKGKDLNEGIGSLVKKGLRLEIQQALDAIRVIGNNAVHPGQLDIKDDITTVNNLFSLVNIIVDDRISQPKKINEVFSLIPQGSLKGIQKRDT